MRKLVLLSCVAASLACIATGHAQTVYYDGSGGNSNLDVSYSAPANTAVSLTTGALSTGAVAFTNENTGTPNLANTVYFGGTISCVQGNSGTYYSPDVSLLLYNNGVPADQYTSVGLHLVNNNPAFWTFQPVTPLSGPSATGANASSLAVPGTLTSFDFVLEIQEASYNQATFSLFLGANADSAAQPATPDYYFPAGVNSLPSVNQLALSFVSDYYTPEAASLTTSNMFGSTVWTPVQSAVVPEPASVSLLSLAGGLLLVRRRRREIL